MHHTRPLFPALLASAILAIATVDYWTGPDIGFSLFYLIPVLIGARDLPRRQALSLAVLAAAGWLFADVGWHGISPIPLWNGLTRLVIFVGGVEAISRMRAEQQRATALNEQLETLLTQEKQVARTDGLTSLGNSRFFLEEYARSLTLWRRSGEPLTVGCIDLDDFKSVNDTHGHSAGDDLLRQIALAIAGGLRAGDVAARVGGDEFAVLLHGCTPETSLQIGERILALVRSVTGTFPDLPLGASMGLAYFEVPPAEPEHALREADRALYTAKARGKHRIELAVLAAHSPAR